MKIQVTSGAGFIGSNLVNELYTRARNRLPDNFDRQVQGNGANARSAHRFRARLRSVLALVLQRPHSRASPTRRA